MYLSLSLAGSRSTPHSQVQTEEKRTTATHLQKSHGDNNSKVRARVGLHSAPPWPLTRHAPIVRGRTRARRASRERERPVFDRVETAALERILDPPDCASIVCLESLHPLVLQRAVQPGRGHDAFEEQRREDGRQEALWGLQQEGGELAQATGGGVARKAQYAGVDGRVEEGEDREEDGEDGYGRGEREGERRGLNMDDSGR